MKKLHSIAFYALVTPAITLGASSLLAQPGALDSDRQNQSEQQREQGGALSNERDAQGAQSSQRTGQPGSDAAADGRNIGSQSRLESRGYLAAAPANGMQAGKIIGADVRTMDDEEVGPVSDLIIDENGQIVAIVVGVGGLFGMGSKDVAIGWDDVTRSTNPDEDELQVSVTRDALRDAPEYQLRN